MLHSSQNLPPILTQRDADDQSLTPLPRLWLYVAYAGAAMTLAAAVLWAVCGYVGVSLCCLLLLPAGASVCNSQRRLTTRQLQARRLKSDMGGYALLVEGTGLMARIHFLEEQIRHDEINRTKLESRLHRERCLAEALHERQQRWLHHGDGRHDDVTPRRAG